MGIWDGIKATVSIGGSVRLEKAKKRYATYCAAYHSLHRAIRERNREIEGRTSKLKSSVARTKRRLKLANAMIAPRCLAILASQGTSNDDHTISRASYSRVTHASLGKTYDLNSTHLALSGAVAGTSAAILAWQGAQVVGIASTGTAMLGLHGAAATNAGWALFGGGSLATGGGGMALGHLVLPGIGTAVAVGVATITTHRQANKLNELSEHIESTNSANSIVLAEVDANLELLRKAEAEFGAANSDLLEAVKTAKCGLRRFGILSVLYRLLRFKISGVYYTDSEWAIVGRLELDIRRFFSSMAVVR